MYRIPNNEFDQLCRHTHVYLQSIGQIPIVYQIPRSHTSHRRTQPYGENKTLASSIDNLIIDTISKIRQPITTIAHSENQEDPEFQNFHDFPEVETGGSGPPELFEINPTYINPLSP